MKCRVCARVATTNLDPDNASTGSLALCPDHGTLVLDALREARSLDRQSRALSFGTPRFLVEDVTKPTELRCDRSTVDENAHTWTGLAGDPCAWCLALYVETLRETRELILGPLGVEEDDRRYPDEVRRRGRRLVDAVAIGLVTRDEARSAFDRWAAHV
jgi:hypothetical protein